MIGLALWRFLRRTPVSTAIAVLGVTLGVSSIVSVHLVTAGVDHQLSALEPFSGYSHFVHGNGLSAADYFTIREAWRRGELEDTTAVMPVIDEFVVLYGQRVRVFGIDLIDALARTEPLPFAQRDGPSSSGFSWQGVWADETLAGDPNLTVNGVLDAPPGTLVADIGVAQQLLGWGPQQISYVALAVRHPLADLLDSIDQLVPGFSAGLPQPTFAPQALVPWRIVSGAEQQPAAQFGRSVLFNVSALSLLALLVAWFVIYQVGVSWVRRLWPVFQRLHAAGAQWRTLRGWFVAMMSLLGLLAGGLGLVFGQLLAQQLQLWVGAALQFDTALDGWLVIKAVGGAVVVSALGGWWASFTAHGGLEFSRARLLAGVGGTALIGWFLLADETGLLGGFAAIALVSVLAMFFVQPLLSLLRGASRSLPGPLLMRLGLRESIWYPADLGVALSALSLAVAVAIGVSVMVDSFRNDFSSMLDQRLSYALLIEGDGAALDEAFAELLHREDVAMVRAYREREIRLKGVPVQLAITDYDQWATARYGFAGPLPADAVMLSEQAARALDVAVGARLLLGGELLTVAHVFVGFGDAVPRMLVDRRQAIARGTPLSALHVDAAQPETLARLLTATRPGLRITSQQQIRDTAMRVFDQTFAITTILIWIALLVAALGLFIAVTAMRLNRRAGLAVMQTLGVTRMENLRVDLLLGAGLGASALLLALPLGLAIAWILCEVINPRAFGWSIAMRTDLAAIGWPLLWGLAAALAAGIVRLGQREEGSHVVAR